MTFVERAHAAGAALPDDELPVDGYDQIEVPVGPYDWMDDDPTDGISTDGIPVDGISTYGISTYGMVTGGDQPMEEEVW